MFIAYEKRIFSKDVVRQLSLLKILYNNDGIEIEDLISKLLLERRIIYKCIDQLRKLVVDQFLKIEIVVSSKGKYFFKGNKRDYYQLRAIIIDKEPITQLAKALLKQKSVEFSHFCSSNYMSESTLKRCFRKVNILLNPLELHLCVCKKQIFLKGSELKVRYCLLSFFWRYYHGVVWPFDGIKENDIYQLLDDLISSNAEISYGKKKQLGYLFAVYILRAETGVLLSQRDFPQYFGDYVYKNQFFEFFLEKVQSKFKLKQIDIGSIFFSLYIFSESYSYIQSSSVSLEILKKLSSQSYDSIMSFVKFVKKKHPNFGIYLNSPSNFLATLIAGRIFVDTFGCLYFNISLIAIFKYAEENFPHLLPSISKAIKKDEPNLSSSILKTLTFRYAQAYVLEFSPRDFEPKIKLLLDTDVPMYEDKLIIERITHLLAPKYNYEWVTLKQTEHPDLIITTGEIEDIFPEVIKVTLNVELSQKDIHNIMKTCEKILDEKTNGKYL